MNDVTTRFGVMPVALVLGLPNQALEAAVRSLLFVQAEHDIVAVIAFVLERRRLLRAWAAGTTEVTDG